MWNVCLRQRVSVSPKGVNDFEWEVKLVNKTGEKIVNQPRTNSERMCASVYIDNNHFSFVWIAFFMTEMWTRFEHTQTQIFRARAISKEHYNRCFRKKQMNSFLVSRLHSLLFRFSSSIKLWQCLRCCGHKKRQMAQELGEKQSCYGDKNKRKMQ